MPIPMVTPIVQSVPAELWRAVVRTPSRTAEPIQAQYSLTNASEA